MRAIVEDVCVLVSKRHDRIKGTLTICESPRDDAVSPRSREEGVSQLREWIRQRGEKEGWHHQSQPS